MPGTAWGSHTGRFPIDPVSLRVIALCQPFHPYMIKGRWLMENEKVGALKEALKMEKDGRAYYKSALEKVESELAKNIFKSLIKAEEKHIQKINQLYDSLTETGEWPQVALVREQGKTQANIFSAAMAEIDEKVKGAMSDIEALKMATRMEDDGMRYYQSKANETDDPFEKKFYHLLVNEESEHYISILDTIEFLEDPQGYFSQLERGTMSF